jgi:hypothetical protein
MKRQVKLIVECDIDDFDKNNRCVRVTLPKCTRYIVDESRVKWKKGDRRFDGEIIGWGNGDECGD